MPSARLTEARAIALKAHPGKITDEELEKEAVVVAYVIHLISVQARSAQEWCRCSDWCGIRK